jgi:hypothetical protein
VKAAKKKANPQARKRASGEAAEVDPMAWINQTWSRYEAQCHLEAYVADKNPTHIIDAFNVLRANKRPISEVMLRNLEDAHRQIFGKANEKPIPSPRYTVRDLSIVRWAMILSDGHIPDPLSDSLATELARRHHTTISNVRVIVSRARLKRAGRSPR